MDCGDSAEPELIGGPDRPEQIVIVDYDEQWPHRFEQIAGRIRGALGDQSIVEHIGSTAVPGLAAKPIIDILLVVNDVADEAAYVAPLQGAGFRLRAREPGHRLLRTPTRDTHLHVYQSGAAEITAYLRLRDWLRTNDGDRDLYASTKRHLAQQRWERMQDYAIAKSNVIASILERAFHATELAATRTRDLLAAEQELETAAAAVQHDLDLQRRLAEIGAPILVGSVAMRVMVRRDIDVTTICPDLDAETEEAITALAATMARHPRVRAVQIRDDTKGWNVDPDYPDGWYLGVQYHDQHGEEWTLDLWFVADPQRQPDLQQLRRVLPALTDERRTTILEIKQARSSRPEHSPGLSTRIYDAVLEQHIHNVDQFDRWQD